jgi:hypothetical protein
MRLEPVFQGGIHASLPAVTADPEARHQFASGAALAVRFGMPMEMFAP